jgi:hypothetical protein
MNLTRAPNAQTSNQQSKETYMNLNDVGEQRAFEVIPEGTICEAKMYIRRGDADEEGVTKRFAGGACRGLDCEFVIEAPEAYAGRKFFRPMVLEGTTDGHAKAAAITLKMLRAIIDSIHGLKHNDESAAARAKREVGSLREFDGVRIMIRVGVEPPKGGYPAKNTIRQVITPDMQEWRQLPQDPTDLPPSGGDSSTPPATNGGAIERPAWAV